MLEDFFTLTEMKDGISTTARIDELVSAIQQLKGSVELNTADSIRQYSTAASTLASTKSEVCLQHFVQLNGLLFLNQWLQEAQNCSGDNSNSAEELIDVILAALERLPVDNEQPTSYGIKSTVQQLLTHGNTKISLKARILCQKWHGALNGSMDCQQKEKEETSEDGQMNPPTASQAAEDNRQDRVSEEATIEAKSSPSVMTCSVAPSADPSINEAAHMMNQLPQLTSPDSSDGNVPLGDVNSSATSLGSHGCLENVSVTEEYSASNDVALASNVALQSNSHCTQSDAEHAASVDATVDAESLEANKLENSHEHSKINKEDRNVSSNLDIRKVVPFTVDITDSQIGAADAANKAATINCCLQDSSMEKIMHKEDSPASSSLKRKAALVDSDSEGIDREVRLKKSKVMKDVNFGGSSKVLETKSTVLSEEMSKPSTDYDDTDALEVARLVAIEVEREVIDYREPFCSSPEINSRETEHAASPDLEAPQKSEPPTKEVNDNKSSNAVVDSRSSSSVKQDGSGITVDSGHFGRKHARLSDVEPYKLDLNANQCTEEVETDCCLKPDPNHSVKLSAPVALTAARDTSMFPPRLHFEGALGWKGSAATSAFRPASPRLTPGERTLLAPTQQTNGMVFDLNVAAGDVAAAAEPLSTAILPTSSGIASKDTSAPVGMRTGVRLELDLNGPCEAQAVQTANNVPLCWNRQPYNSDQSQPSSSSMQPGARNFDLNDSGSIFDGSSSQGNESPVRTCGNDDSAVTIFGKRITLKEEDHRKPHLHCFLGPDMDDMFSERAMQPEHMPPSNFGVASYSTGYATIAMSFPPPFYAPGSIPHVVDARRVPLTPPMMGVGLSHPSLASRTSVPSSNEFSYFPATMDLNRGLGSTEAEGSMKPMSFQGHDLFVDEHRSGRSQGGNPRGQLKRKEPDSGWEPYNGR